MVRPSCLLYTTNQAALFLSKIHHDALEFKSNFTKICHEVPINCNDTFCNGKDSKCNYQFRSSCTKLPSLTIIAVHSVNALYTDVETYLFWHLKSCCEDNWARHIGDTSEPLKAPKLLIHSNIFNSYFMKKHLMSHCRKKNISTFKGLFLTENKKGAQYRKKISDV